MAQLVLASNKGETIPLCFCQYDRIWNIVLVQVFLEHPNPNNVCYQIPQTFVQLHAAFFAYQTMSSTRKAIPSEVSSEPSQPIPFLRCGLSWKTSKRSSKARDVWLWISNPDDAAAVMDTLLLLDELMRSCPYFFRHIADDKMFRRLWRFVVPDYKSGFRAVIGPAKTAADLRATAGRPDIVVKVLNLIRTRS